MKKIEYILLTLLAIAILSSCGTKKKGLKIEKEKTEITAEVETQEEETQVIEEKKDTSIETESTFEKKQVVITDTQEKEFDIDADEGGQVTVIEEKTDTGTVKTFIGVNSVSVRQRSTNVVDSLRVRNTLLKTEITVWVRKDSTSQDKISKLTLELEIEKKNKVSQKEVDYRSGFFFWGFFILLVIIIAYIAYRRYFDSS